jgi:hypothetical protein
MLRRGTAFVIAVLAACLASTMAATAAEPLPAKRPVITLSMPTSAMAEVPENFRISATPASSTARAVAILQVKTSRGFETLQRRTLDARGRTRGVIVSNQAETRTYRAALLSKRGRVITTSRPVTVTWTPLSYTARLDCEMSTAPVRVEIPCTISVTPQVNLAGILASLQFRGKTDWVPLEAMPVNSKGLAQSHVDWHLPGVGEYRVQLLRKAVVLAESAPISITYY